MLDKINSRTSSKYLILDTKNNFDVRQRKEKTVFLNVVITICIILHHNICLIEGRVLKHCEFIREMKSLGVPKEEWAVWACIGQFESKLNTNAISEGTNRWSKNYGLFQVSDRKWCAPSSTTAFIPLVTNAQLISQGTFKEHLLKPTSGNLCQLKCEELLDDRIEKALKCAQLIRQIQGWKAWSIYAYICSQGSLLPNPESCFQ